MSRGWLRSPWVRYLLGLLAGAAVGLAIYVGSRLHGPSLFVLCGAAAGAAAAIVVHGYGRSVRLTDITVTVPQFTELHFAVTRDSQQVAWKLFVEAVTRVSVQPLDSASGLIREVLNSLYGLFAITRDILKQTRPSRQTGNDPTVEQLAIAMLNIELRPFLSRWHPALLSWEQDHPDTGEEEWPDAAECRAALAAAQRRLVNYVLSFGKLAGVPNARQIVEGTLGSPFTAPASSVPNQSVSNGEYRRPVG
ncbi:MAG TPA: hypothetical protein VFC00_05180 [Micromonosporaceae bacterium]|nr:hypothetical protein [Micromonosporaceae bacterium]